VLIRSEVRGLNVPRQPVGSQHFAGSCTYQTSKLCAAKSCTSWRLLCRYSSPRELDRVQLQKIVCIKIVCMNKATNCGLHKKLPSPSTVQAKAAAGTPPRRCGRPPKTPIQSQSRPMVGMVSQRTCAHSATPRTASRHTTQAHPAVTQVQPSHTMLQCHHGKHAGGHCSHHFTPSCNFPPGTSHPCGTTRRLRHRTSPSAMPNKVLTYIQTHDR